MAQPKAKAEAASGTAKVAVALPAASEGAPVIPVAAKTPAIGRCAVGLCMLASALKSAESCSTRRVPATATVYDGSAEVSLFDIDDYPLLKGKHFKVRDRRIAKVPKRRIHSE